MKCKRDRDREIESRFNVEFRPPPTLHGHKSPPTEDFTPLLFLNQICSQGAYTTLLGSLEEFLMISITQECRILTKFSKESSQFSTLKSHSRILQFKNKRQVNSINNQEFACLQVMSSFLFLNMSFNQVYIAFMRNMDVTPTPQFISSPALNAL